MSIESQKRMGVKILKTTTTERIAKIMTENSPNLVKDINLKTQAAQLKKKKEKEAPWILKRTNSKKSHPKICNNQTAENSKLKKNSWKQTERQHIIYKRNKDSHYCSFSSKSMEMSGKWHNNFRKAEGKNYQHRTLYQKILGWRWNKHS